MRAIDQTDFETSNVQYIEFWMQSPFLAESWNGTGGQLYMDLGSYFGRCVERWKKIV